MYLIKKAKDLRGAGLGDYFVGFSGSGIGLKAHWGPKEWAKPMTFIEALAVSAVWPDEANIVEIVREQ